MNSPLEVRSKPLSIWARYRPSNSQRILLGCIVLFLIIRTPLMYRQPGGQDEDYYAMPGLTILENGIPRLPHVPARNLESAFFKADEALFAEPPLSFYVQAAFYAVLPHQYGTARLASAAAGMTFLVLVYQLAQEFGCTPFAALWAAGLLSMSKWFYFPATTARPDMLCAVFGLASVLCVLRGLRHGGHVWFSIAGIFLGLGGLTHPFAIVFAVQLAFWTIAASGGKGRWSRPGLLAGISILVALLWTPMILAYPEAFRVQVQNQFQNAGSEPLWFRAVMPWTSLWYHAGVMWEHTGAWQFSLAIGSLAFCSMAAWWECSPSLRLLCGLAWSAILLMSVLVGSHHPVIGYWVYPAGLMFICVGLVLQWVFDELAKRESGRRLAHWPLGLAVVLLMTPGMGLRTLAAHLSHWNEIEYDAPRFAQRLIDSLPPHDVFAVDTPFTLDFYVAGRATLLAQTMPLYFQLEQADFDYLIVSRSGKSIGIAQKMNGKLLRVEGLPDQLFACYAEIYAAPKRSSVKFKDRAVD